MTRIIQLTIAVLLIPAVAFSQGFDVMENNNDEGWEFSQYAPPDTSIASVHGLAFDGAGHLWTAGYYVTSEVVDEDTLSARELNCLEGDLETVCEDAPLYGVEHADSTLRFGQMTGLDTDHNGDLIVSMDSYMYEVEDEDSELGYNYALTADRSFILRIDHQTHELMDIYEPENFSWHVAVDDEGYIYASDVVDAQQIKIIDPDFEPLAVVDDDRPGITRDIAVSGDGTRVYQPLTTDWVYVYESDAGPFGEYELADSIMQGSHSGAIDVNPVTDEVVATADGKSWGISVDPDEWDPWGIYVLDPEEDHEIVDEFSWDLAGEEPTDDNWPVFRTNAIHPDGNKLVVGSFGAFGLQVYEGPQVVSAEDDEVLSDVPEGYDLEQNYPNPFNPNTNIEFTIPETQQVSLTVYDVQGREVETLVDEQMQQGSHTVTFEAGDISSGTYIYQLDTGEYQISRQMMFVK